LKFVLFLCAASPSLFEVSVIRGDYWQTSE
jgi:hypothetical protein